MCCRPPGHRVHLIDLPGTYSLRGRSPDEEMTRDVVLGRLASETPPDLCSGGGRDQSACRVTTRDRAQADRPHADARAEHDRHRAPARIHIDLTRLSVELGVPVVTSIAVRRGGTEELLRRMDEMAAGRLSQSGENTWKPPTTGELRAAQREADRVIAAAVGTPARPDTLTARVDAVLLHPVAGLSILLCTRS